MGTTAQNRFTYQEKGKRMRMESWGRTPRNQ